MPTYTLKNYQKGCEPDQARIGREVAQNWIWPLAYDLDDLLALHARPDFDPDTRHYCFLGDEMVGYMFSVIGQNGAEATLDFPRLLPGHESAAELLLEKAFETLKRKGVSRIVGRVTSMVPGDVRLAEKSGFRIYDWGHKVYYEYQMAWGRLPVPVSPAVEEIDAENGLAECAEVAALWYKRPAESVRSLLAEWRATGWVITHLGIRKLLGAGGRSPLIATGMVAPNLVRRSTAAFYNIYAPDADSLIPLLVSGVNRCVDQGLHNLIVDLIHENLLHEPVYQQLGFHKVAEWARCEKPLD
ncbi:MAG TPA: hypothetical protein VFF78_06130, partial [Anaerolineaceae bacterium]|nr:hypothetical protein [Anaerolineaceae bacterium]